MGRLLIGHVDAARLLLDKGAEVDRADGLYGKTPLRIACQNGPRRRGADVAGQRRGGRSGDYKWCDAIVCRLPERPRRRRAAVAGARGGYRGEDGVERYVAGHCETRGTCFSRRAARGASEGPID